MGTLLKAKMAAAFASYAMKASRVPVGPLFVTLETGNKCNLRCPMCPQSTRQSDFPEGNMPVEVFEDLLNRVSRFTPIACLTMHLSAEPTLHPELPRLIARTREVLGMRPGFASNGFSMTNARGKDLVQAGLGWVTFDFCADKKAFEENRFPAKWERTYDNIRAFLETVRQHSSPVTVTIKNVDWRPDDGASLERLKSLFEGLPVSRYENYRLHNWSGDFAEGAAEKLSTSFLTGGTYYPCSHLWFSMIVAWDGRLHLCCRDTEGEHVIGNTASEDLLEVWNGPEYRRLRRLHAGGKYAEIPACKACDRIWTGGYAGGTPLQMVKRNIYRVFSRGPE